MDVLIKVLVYLELRDTTCCFTRFLKLQATIPAAAPKKKILVSIAANLPGVFEEMETDRARMLGALLLWKFYLTSYTFSERKPPLAVTYCCRFSCNYG